MHWNTELDGIYKPSGPVVTPDFRFVNSIEAYVSMHNLCIKYLLCMQFTWKHEKGLYMPKNKFWVKQMPNFERTEYPSNLWTD